MGNAPNILCFRCKEQEEPHPHFIFYCSLSKTTVLIYFSKLVSKSHWELSSQFHDGAHLKILIPTLSEGFLRHFYYCRLQAFHDDGYDKINELYNFNCNLVSCFNKLTEILLLNWAQKKPF